MPVQNVVRVTSLYCTRNPTKGNSTIIVLVLLEGRGRGIQDYEKEGVWP